MNQPINRWRNFLSFGLACAGLAASAAAASIEIKTLEPTVLFLRRDPLAQVARMTVDNQLAQEISGTLRVALAGVTWNTALTIRAGLQEVEVAVPDIARAAELKVEFRRGDEVCAHRAVPWQPQRKWKIHLVKASHEDLGYENYIFKKQSQIADNIDRADEISRPKKIGNSTNVREDGYHYVMESLVFQRAYLEERGEAAWRALVRAQVKPGGGLSLMGAPSGVHSHWMDYEELARMTYPARREAKDRFGLDLKTFMIVDNPSLSWSGAQVLAEAGFKYIARWGQVWRTGENNTYATTQLPALFWWQAPDRQHRVLFGWRSGYALNFWYGQTGGGHLGTDFDLPGRWINSYLRGIESGADLGPYPYDAVIVPSYVDHETPRFDKRQHTRWVERYAFPQIVYTSPDTFFAYIEKNYGADLPVRSGDLNNFSADYATIDPESQGWKREASRILPAAEGLGVLATARNPGYLLLPAGVERTYTRMFDYDEHSWPTVPAVNDEQLFNATWVKKHEARRALDAACEAQQNAAAQFVRQIATDGRETIAVFNSLVHPRTAVVETAGDFKSLVDLRTGRRVACQPAGDGRVIFLAENIPAYGYALFAVDNQPRAADQTNGLEVGPDWMASRYYRVQLDVATGAVSSIIERATGRELVDQTAPYQVNQLLYVHTPERDSKERTTHVPRNVTGLKGSPGVVRAEFQVNIDDAKTGAAIRQSIRLYRDLPRIDFVNELRHVRVMHTDDLKERYNDNLFFAFPLAVPGGQSRVEYPGGVVRPHDDQLRWGSHDYLYANRWVDVSNPAGGVTLSPWNAGTFHFGGIRYNEFSVDYRPENSWLFSHAWSNRMAGLLTLGPEDCNATVGYSLTSHAGDWDTGTVTPFAWSTASPLLVFPLPVNQPGVWKTPAKGFLQVDQPNVQLSVLKSSVQPGRGWVVRLVETEGRSTECELDAGELQAERAFACDLVENDLNGLAVRDGKVRVTLLPFGHATVRLISGVAPPAAPVWEPAVAGDATVRLRWQPATSAGAYNVYRSDDPDAPPTAYNLVGRTDRPEFSDRDLNLMTTYFYRVAAVSAGNLEGPSSPLLSVATLAENRTPPASVRELGVVRRARDTLIVYWRKSPEPDTARYVLYRGATADFDPAGTKPVAVIERSGDFLETHIDRDLRPGTRYYYKVHVLDWAGNRQEVSPVATAVTPH